LASHSGASQWTAARRHAYANDLGAERSLVTVTAKSNRSKADQGPAQCTYLADWGSTKLRWPLTVAHTEMARKVACALGGGSWHPRDAAASKVGMLAGVPPARMGRGPGVVGRLPRDGNGRRLRAEAAADAT
jgi:hypothetical protein